MYDEDRVPFLRNWDFYIEVRRGLAVHARPHVDSARYALPGYYVWRCVELSHSEAEVMCTELRRLGSSFKHMLRNAG